MINLFFTKKLKKKLKELELKNQELDHKVVQQHATIFLLNITMSQLQKDCLDFQRVLNILLNNSDGEILIPNHKLVDLFGDPKPISKYFDEKNNCFVITNKGVDNYGTSVSTSKI